MGPLGLCSESIRTYACQKIFDFGQTKNFQDLLDPFWKKSKPIDPENSKNRLFGVLGGVSVLEFFFE